MNHSSSGSQALQTTREEGCMSESPQTGKQSYGQHLKLFAGSNTAKGRACGTKVRRCDLLSESLPISKDPKLRSFMSLRSSAEIVERQEEGV